MNCCAEHEKDIFPAVDVVKDVWIVQAFHGEKAEKQQRECVRNMMKVGSVEDKLDGRKVFGVNVREMGKSFRGMEMGLERKLQGVGKDCIS